MQQPLETNFWCSVFSDTKRTHAFLPTSACRPWRYDLLSDHRAVCSSYRRHFEISPDSLGELQCFHLLRLRALNTERFLPGRDARSGSGRTPSAGFRVRCIQAVHILDQPAAGGRSSCAEKHSRQIQPRGPATRAPFEAFARLNPGTYHDVGFCNADQIRSALTSVVFASERLRPRRPSRIGGPKPLRNPIRASARTATPQTLPLPVPPVAPPLPGVSGSEGSGLLEKARRLYSEGRNERQAHSVRCRTSSDFPHNHGQICFSP